MVVNPAYAVPKPTDLPLKVTAKPAYVSQTHPTQIADAVQYDNKKQNLNSNVSEYDYEPYLQYDYICGHKLG